MNNINRLLITLIMLFAMTVNINAQQYYEEEAKARNWYADRCGDALADFEQVRKNPKSLPQKFTIFQYQKASPLGYALVIANTEESELIMFTPDGGKLKAQIIGKDILQGDYYWDGISDLGHNRTKNTDITKKERPLPVRNPVKKSNVFEVVVEEGEKIPDIKAYNQMIFKPHKNSVRLADQNEVYETNEDGVVIKDKMEYIFKLSNPSVMPKMFRGYEDEEMCPWVVKSSFFNKHSLLQYSRWKNGEMVKKATPDACRIISQYYGGRKIKDTRWLATLESGERSFYAVQFEHKDKDALAALVSIGEGMVNSVWEFHGEIDPNNYDSFQSIWFVDDEGDFMPHSPEIHCIAATDEGLELYVRLFGGESVQYFVLREIGPILMEIQSDCWVYVWD